MRSAHRLLLPDDLDAWTEFEAPDEPCYAMVSSLDSIAAARRNVGTLLDERDNSRSVLVDTGEKAIGGLSDLPSHAILDRGRVIGLWEFDPETSSIAWGTFGMKKTKQLTSVIEETELFVREQLGDVRSFSLDSPKTRVKRIGAVRGLK